MLHLHSYLKLSLVLLLISGFTLSYLSCNSSDKNDKDANSKVSKSTKDNTCTVWPGDADNNGVVEISDILSIGLMYGQKGNKRDSVSIKFKGQKATKWGESLPNKANIAHTDCNGDGTINSADTSAIIQNIDSLHQEDVSPSLPITEKTSLTLDVVSKGKCDRSSSPKCSKITFKMNLDDIKNLYGASFALKYDNTTIDSIISTKLNSTCLDKKGNDFISILKHDNDKNEVYVGLTRTNPEAGDVPCGSLGNITMEIMEFDDGNGPFFKLSSDTSSNLISSLNKRKITFSSIENLNINE